METSRVDGVKGPQDAESAPLLLVLRLDVVHAFSGVLIFSYSYNFRVLRLDAAGEAEDDRIF